MKTRTTSLLAIALAATALAAATPSYAQAGPGNPPPGGPPPGGPPPGGMMGDHHRMGPGRMMEMFDANKDGAISKDEFLAERKGDFKIMDPDGNGKVTKAEFPAMVEKVHEQRRREHQDRMFDMLDANKDGTVTQEEFNAAVEKRFGRMDRNGDGKLSPDDRPKR